MSGTTSDPVLVVTDLHKEFGSLVAVDSVSFRLPAGGALGIVGESGSGKSTVARMLLGLVRPTRGSVEICGQPVDVRRRVSRDRAAQIQMIFQDPRGSFDPRRTVRESLAEPLRLHHPQLGPDGTARRVEELLDQVGLSRRQGDAVPAELSGGQRQRAAIARALGIAPQVLVLDEAVAALDVSIQAQVLTLLARIRRDTGTALLFVSHDLAVVEYLCDEVLVMRRGELVERGDVRHVLATPTHPYTRLLLDSVPRPGWDLARIRQDRRDLEAAAGS